MPSVTLLARLSLAIFLLFLLFFGGCSYLPWIGDEEDDLAFEEDITFEDEEMVDDFPKRKRGKKARRERTVEDDFFADSEDDSISNSLEDDGMEDEGSDGFASMDQETDQGELQGDVESLQNQQEALISKVRELEEMLNTLEPKIDAATERIEGGVSSATDSADFLEPEVEDLKAQVARLNEEISRIKMQKSRVQNRPKARRSKMKIPPEYDRALSAYRSRNYDESILLFQNLALSNPPNQLKDNIEFWIGSNYVALEMYDDAILQFETVLNKYPRVTKLMATGTFMELVITKKVVVSVKTRA